MSYRAAFAQNVIRTAIRDETPPPIKTPPVRLLPEPPLPICVIGAGAAGLYAALILKSLNMPFEVLEASERVGGRCFTHHFSSADFDYFDVGAMRFPDVPGMAPTFNLFGYLQLQNKLLPYFLSSENTALLYNDKRILTPPNDPTGDVFRVGVNNGGTVSQTVADQPSEKWIDAVFGPFYKAFQESFDKGWKMIMQYDMLSTRGYMQGKLGYQGPDITWLETRDTGTGMFDQSLTENVMDYLEFGDPNANSTFTSSPSLNSANVAWVCLEGGAQVLTDAMMTKLDAPIQLKQRVTRISFPLVDASDVLLLPLQVDIDGGPPRNYRHVISTMPLPCLQTVDLEDAGLDYRQKVAIRSCYYEPSVKVGLKFNTRWWQQPAGTIVGGQSKTELPLRTIVYPSYGDAHSPGVMIASYAWGQDASRLGALIGKDEDQLLTIILEGIARLHQVPIKTLRDELLAYYPHDWYHDEFSRGAFAHYGPSQFTELFPGLTRPAAAGKLHFAGEATSVHHAWVAGALASSWRAVAEILMSDGMSTEEAKKKLEDNGWPKPEEVDMELLVKQVAIGSVVKS